ncbi:hypothetical protein, partial [Acidomonas methanolica]|uniref:hypothetical protein n=1 Tax=Acidomonas methanolica TaxID=437 RepID=UPI001FB77979
MLFSLEMSSATGCAPILAAMQMIGPVGRTFVTGRLRPPLIKLPVCEVLPQAANSTATVRAD